MPPVWGSDGVWGRVKGPFHGVARARQRPAKAVRVEVYVLVKSAAGGPFTAPGWANALRTPWPVTRS
jgi:hypothetical protein